MASRRQSTATTFFAILGLGGLAVAIVAVAVTLSASAAQRIELAGRDRAAVDLLEQRLILSSLLAAEQAAEVVDQMKGPDSMLAAPIRSQRTTAMETAIDRLDELTDRTDSVGNESQRWLTSLRSIASPEGVSDPYDRLVAYDTALGAACCSGIVPSDRHHGGEVGELETAASLSQTVWEYFYLDVEQASRRGPGITPAVDQFMEQLGVADPPGVDGSLLSDSVAILLGGPSSLGISNEAINTLLASDAVRTLDNVVLNVTGRSSIVVSTDEAFAAADAAQRSIDELVRGAIESTRKELAASSETAAQTRLVAGVVAPILLVVLAVFGFVASRFARNREHAARREQSLLDARNRFIRMVSHELRTPATAISGFAEMLGSDWTSLTEHEIAEFLAIINRQSTHLSLLVEDLLTLSHLETGRLRLHLSVVNLSQVATEAIAPVDGRYTLEIETTIDPSITVVADPDRLVQIIRNLVENAAKYGKVGVSVSAAVVGGSCNVVVSDAGPGVPAELAERIFKFWDTNTKDGSRVRGYGMGLAIARHLARAMVGDLAYRPHHPVGSEFVLTLPLGPPDVNSGARSTAAEAMS